MCMGFFFHIPTYLLMNNPKQEGKNWRFTFPYVKAFLFFSKKGTFHAKKGLFLSFQIGWGALAPNASPGSYAYAIDIIINKAFSITTLFHGFSSSQFRKFLCLSVKTSHFLIKNCIYQQIDGVAMGSPPGPLFTNIFLAFHEGSWLANCPPKFKPPFFSLLHWWLFCCFPLSRPCSSFLKLLELKAS